MCVFLLSNRTDKKMEGLKVIALCLIFGALSNGQITECSGKWMFIGTFSSYGCMLCDWKKSRREMCSLHSNPHISGIA